jgi:hypothetical protein
VWKSAEVKQVKHIYLKHLKRADVLQCIDEFSLFSTEVSPKRKLKLSRKVFHRKLHQLLIINLTNFIILLQRLLIFFNLLRFLITLRLCTLNIKFVVQFQHLYTLYDNVIFKFYHHFRLLFFKMNQLMNVFSFLSLFFLFFFLRRSSRRIFETCKLGGWPGKCHF